MLRGSRRLGTSYSATSAISARFCHAVVRRMLGRSVFRMSASHDRNQEPATESAHCRQNKLFLSSSDVLPISRRKLVLAVTWTDELAEIDWDDLAELYRLAPLGERNPLKLEQVFSNSMFRCFVFDGGRVVGAGRVLADGADCACLCDIAVLPSHQGRGLGRHIIQRLVDKSKLHEKIILYAAPGKEPLYEKFGFRRMTTAMAIFEDPAKAFSDGYLTRQ